MTPPSRLPAMPLLRTLLAGVLFIGAGPVAAETLPWKFDMSHDDVRAVTRYGPYKSFSDGDLESYKGVFEGHEENFQFAFRDDKLFRIGVYLYEGTDAQAAAAKWFALHSLMASRYGSLRTPGNVPPADDRPESGTTFETRAIEIATTSGKTAMAPLKQPDDMPVMATLASGMVQGKRWYYVIFAYMHP